MRLLFEICTTCNKPVFISLNTEWIMIDVCRRVSNQIEENTMLMKDDIRDIFIIDKEGVITSIGNNPMMLLEDFIKENTKYFGNANHAYRKNIYKLHVIDKTYLDFKLDKRDTPLYSDFIPPTETTIVDNVIKPVRGFIKKWFLPIE